MAMNLKIGLDAITSYRRLSYTPWHALAEFVDNSTQAYFNNKSTLDRTFADEKDKLEVSITYDPGNDYIFISDTSMGMNREELEHAMHVGLKPLNAAGRSKYGMGMKTAACWLGDRWSVRTKKLGETTEYTVEVDVPQVAQGNEKLAETAKPNQDPQKHYTIIEIHSLHRAFQGRTLSKIKDFLRSMYRQDFRDNTLKLLWRGTQLSWDEVEEQLLKARDGTVYKKPFKFTLHGDKEVKGWVGVLRNGSRANAGFSILHCGRVVKGWPDAWRPTSLYGQLQGSNDLINQRLVGEIHLDAFQVSHTKDDILWLGDEEEKVEEELEKECREYRSVAKELRKKGMDQRGPSDIETEAAVEEFRKELESPEIVDAIELTVTPEPPAIKQAQLSLVDAERSHPETFRVQVAELTIKVFLSRDKSTNDPYFVCDATKSSELCVVVNCEHPHWGQLMGSEGVLNYLRHCVYDALAEHMARHKKSTIEPETIKLFKDRFLRIPFEIEADSQQAAAGDTLGGT
jgi:hypothetical protein